MCWSLVTSGAETPCASTTMWPTRSRFVTCRVPSAFRLEPRFLVPPRDVAFCSALLLMMLSYIRTTVLPRALYTDALLFLDTGWEAKVFVYLPSASTVFGVGPR